MQLGIVTPVLTRTPKGHAPWEVDAGIREVAQVVQAADDLGYHHVTCSEHIGIPVDVAAVRGSTYWDPLAVFGYLAALTERIRFTTYVLVLAYHHPLEIVKRYGTLDRVCGGRLVLGVGVGSLQEEFDLTYIFVAHDLGVVRHVADRVAVMYLGKIVELGPADEVYANPVHPYTEALLSAVPIPDPQANRERAERILEGDVPSPANPPEACRFHTRCPYATEVCSEVEPELLEHRRRQWAACHHPLNVGAGQRATAAASE